jgi:DNA-binding transcriptional LysR family regulator
VCSSTSNSAIAGSTCCRKASTWPCGSVCASPEYLARRGLPESPQELGEHDCLVYSNLPDPDQWNWFDDQGQRQRVRVNIVMSANNGDLLGNAAAEGVGIVMQPTFIAHRHIRTGALVPLLTETNWPHATAWAVYPPGRHLSYRVREFIDFLAGYFAETPYWDLECERDS